MSSKKMIVTVNLVKLNESDFGTKGKSIAQAHVDKPTYVPGLSPAATVVQGKFDALDTLYAKREALSLEQIENTKLIVAARLEITNIITDDWAPQTQKACAGSPEKVLALGYGIWGEYDGQAEPEATVLNSYPELDPLIKGTHLVHYLNMVNSITHKIAKPKDVKDTEVYMFFGEQPPANYKDMKYLGCAKNGKYTVTFTEEEVGKTVWYFAVYVARKKGTPSMTAGKVRALVV
jgi:hypothetical protein